MPPYARPCVADRLGRRLGIIRGTSRSARRNESVADGHGPAGSLWRFVSSRIVSNTLFTSTALPRVGVARPNGSYVARTHLVCWTRDSLSSWTEKAAESSRLPNALLHEYEWRRRSRNSSLFPLALYAVAKVKLRVP